MMGLRQAMPRDPSENLVCALGGRIAAHDVMHLPGMTLEVADEPRGIEHRGPVDAAFGQGRVLLFGPEILFRAQPHGTFKFFFNGLYLSAAPADF